MKSDLIDLVKTAKDQHQALQWMREYIQARLLAVLQDEGAMIPLAFHGGTALRFLFQLPRYSEDLDFALEGDTKKYDFHAYLNAISEELKLEGYLATIKFNDRKTVQSAFINFHGLLYDLQLSPHADQKFSIKLEVDANPPQAAVLTTSLIRYRELFLNIQHHDKASLLSGKIHALLQLNYLKGRDIYDLVWYLSDSSWPPPNIRMLNNALAQTKWEGGELSLSNWKNVLLERLEQFDLNHAKADVAPFLERQADLKLLEWNIIKQLLGCDR